jgi:hypothetical protein
MARGGKTIFTVAAEAPSPRRKLPSPPKAHRDKKSDYRRRKVKMMDLEGE